MKKNQAHIKRASNELLDQLTGPVRHVQHGWDRLKFKLDSSAPDLDLKVLKRHAKEADFYPHEDKFHRQWKRELWISQPSDSFFPALLEQVNEAGHAIEPLYVERTIDRITKTTAKAAALTAATAGHVSRPNSQRLMGLHECGNTFYLGARGDDVVLTLYGHWPSRLQGPWQGRSCARVEMRVQGAATLQRLKMSSIEDLMAFDGDSFWNEQTRFWLVPSMQDLGRWVRGDDDVSGDTFRREAYAYLDRFTVGDSPNMHNVVAANRNILRLLAGIQPDLVFRA